MSNYHHLHCTTCDVDDDAEGINRGQEQLEQIVRLARVFALLRGKGFDLGGLMDSMYARIGPHAEFAAEHVDHPGIHVRDEYGDSYSATVPASWRQLVEDQ